MLSAAGVKRRLLKGSAAGLAAVAAIGCLGCGSTPTAARDEPSPGACSMLPWGTAEANLGQTGTTSARTNSNGRVALTLRDATPGCPVGGPTGRIDFTVELFGISNVTAVHIHNTQDATAGPPRVVLFEGSPTPGVSGRLVEGSFTDVDVKGMTLAQLEGGLCNGGAYVDVHTTTHPEGEIRGVIVGDGMRCRPTGR